MNWIAFLVGNNDYPHVGNLARAIDDIGAVKKALTIRGFKVISIENAALSTFYEELASFCSNIGEGDTAIFWFAGHGAQVNNQQFLLPVDFHHTEKTVWSRAAIRLNEVIDEVGVTKAARALFFIDACRNNPWQSAPTYHRGLGLVAGPSGPRTPPTSYMIVFSADHEETALDRLGPTDYDDLSLFAREFLPIFATRGISIKDAIAKAQRAVREKSIEYLGKKGRQSPVSEDHTGGEDFYLFDLGSSPTTDIEQVDGVNSSAAAATIVVKDACQHIRIYISYAPPDEDHADRYKTLLSSAGFTAYKSPRQFHDAIPISQEALTEIKSCHFFLLLVSNSSTNSELVQRELGLAKAVRERGGTRPIILPIYLRDDARASRLPDFAFPVRDFETGDLQDDFPLYNRALGMISSDEVLISLMLPTLLVSRRHFHDVETFDRTGAYKVYNDLFPVEEQDSWDDIVKWVLRDDLGQPSQSTHKGVGLIEYQLDSRYFILTLAGQAIGLGFFTYDYSSRLVFGNYIAVQEGWRAGALAKNLVDKIVEVLGEIFPEYRGIMFEVERLNREYLGDIIDSLYARNGTFRSKEEEKEVRKFLRIAWYQSINAFFFVDGHTGEPLSCKSPCLDPDEKNWENLEEEYWIMWYNRPGTIFEMDELSKLWKEVVYSVYIEILAKSLVAAYPLTAAKYWKYANEIVNERLDTPVEVSFGKYLHRRDSNLLQRWIEVSKKYNIDLAI